MMGAVWTVTVFFFNIFCLFIYFTHCVPHKVRKTLLWCFTITFFYFLTISPVTEADILAPVAWEIHPPALTAGLIWV